MNNHDDLHSLSHTKWSCKYHVVFAPKYRRNVVYKEKRLEIGKTVSGREKRKSRSLSEMLSSQGDARKTTGYAIDIY